MKYTKSHLLVFYFYLLGVICLFLNDRIWKYEYSNWLSGKLSDFIGLLILPIFIGILIPKSKKLIALIIGCLFVLWKMPISNTFINIWNNYMFVHISRTIDYSDFIALIMLFVAHQFLRKLEIQKFKNVMHSSIHPIILNIIFIFSCIVLCSTSVQEPSYPKGDVLIDKSYRVNKTENQILRILEKEGFDISTESAEFYLYSGNLVHKKYYQIDTLIINRKNNLDTLYKVNFKVKENNKNSSLTIINFSVKDDWNLQDWKRVKFLQKRYKPILKSEIIDKLKP